MPGGRRDAPAPYDDDCLDEPPAGYSPTAADYDVPDEVAGLVDAGILAAPPILDPTGEEALAWRGLGPYAGLEVAELEAERWVGEAAALSSRLAAVASSALALLPDRDLRAYLAPISRYVDFKTMTVPFRAIAPGELERLDRERRARLARDEELRNSREASREDPIASIREQGGPAPLILGPGPLEAIGSELAFEEAGPLSRAGASHLYPPRARMRELILCGGAAWLPARYPSPKDALRARGSLAEADFSRLAAQILSDAALAVAMRGFDADAGKVPKAAADQVKHLRKGDYDPDRALDGYRLEAGEAVSSLGKALSNRASPALVALCGCLEGPDVRDRAVWRLAALLMIGFEGHVLREVRPSTGASPPALTRERLDMLRTARPKRPDL